MPRRLPNPAAVQAAGLVLTTGATITDAAKQYGVGRFAVQSVLRKRAQFFKPTDGLEDAYARLRRLFDTSPLEFRSAAEMSQELNLSQRTIRKWLWWSGQAKDAMLFWRRCRREVRRQQLLDEYRTACVEAQKILPRSDPRVRWSTQNGRKVMLRYFPSWVHFQNEAQLPRWLYDRLISPTYLEHEHALTRRLDQIDRLPRAYRPRKRWTPLVELAQRYFPADHPLQPALARYQSDRHHYRIAARKRAAERRRAFRLRREGALDEPHVPGVGADDRGRGLGAHAEGPHPGEGATGGAVVAGPGGVRPVVEGQADQDDRS